MSKHDRVASLRVEAGPNAPSANSLPLDEASRVPVGPGVEGRYGLCPVPMLIPNPHRVQVHSRRQLHKLSSTLR